MKQDTFNSHDSLTVTIISKANFLYGVKLGIRRPRQCAWGKRRNFGMGNSFTFLFVELGIFCLPLDGMRIFLKNLTWNTVFSGFFNVNFCIFCHVNLWECAVSGRVHTSVCRSLLYPYRL